MNQKPPRPAPRPPLMPEDLHLALAAHRAGNLAGAAQLYNRVLAADARNFDALHLLGIVQSQLGNRGQAIGLFQRALAVNPRSAEAHANLGRAQMEAGAPDAAAASYERALALKPDLLVALSNYSIILRNRGRPQEALAQCERALALDPKYADAANNKGNALFDLGRHEEALAAYDRALALAPGMHEASLGRANAFAALKRHDEALAAYREALGRNPRSAKGWYGSGNALFAAKRFDEALAAYDKALGLAPQFADAWAGRGNALVATKRLDEALAAHDRALALNPLVADAWAGRGDILFAMRRHAEALLAYDRLETLRPEAAALGRSAVLAALRRFDEAIAVLDRAVAADPGFAAAWSAQGDIFTIQARFDEAFAACAKALALQPEIDYVEGQMLHAQLHRCNWNGLDALAGRILDRVDRGEPAAIPFILLAVTGDPRRQLDCARAYAARQYPARNPQPFKPAVRHERIRVAYLSGDLRNHPVAWLLAGLFDRHDRAKFETIAVSFCRDGASDMQRRIRSACGRFIDADDMRDHDVARLLRELEIDIAVDLMGYTSNCRPGIMALRPAPVQVNYLGYPGTTGADFIDYIIADDHVAPPHLRAFYSEQVACLPDTFQANDRLRPCPQTAPSRSALGLPEGRFVFCCFNSNAKITPAVFDIWMRLLQGIDASVLWLFSEGAATERNLRREAECRGVDPGRLVFAPAAGYVDYLARYRAADLFLDTFPFNGGTTVSDALWVGLPVVTCSGEAFSSRMGGSLLAAAGLPELVAPTLADYERLAFGLAAGGKTLAALRQRLNDDRERCALFDTDRFRRHIEAAYREMHERRLSGEPPGSFSVAAIDAAE